MKGIFRRFMMVNKGLRYKLMLAFSLMSVIPLLACTYIITLYTFPQVENLIDISSIIVLAIFVSISGLVLGRKLVDPVIDMALEAKIIASGEYDRKIEITGDDEIGHLGHSVNVMTQKIKSNLDELKNYGQRMREINVEVHKKVLALSSLLQIGDIISAGNIQLDSLLELAVEKVAMVFDTGFAVLYLAAKEESGDFLVKTSYNVTEARLENLVIKHDDRTILNKAVQDRTMLIIDESVKMSKEMETFIASANLKNIIAVPLYSGKKNMGLLVIGTRLDDYKYNTDDIDLVKVFAKQMTIAIESDLLSKKTEELAIKDELTDLYNKNFIVVRLEDEIKRAIFYQRPCSFIIFNIDNFKKFRENQGEIAAEEAIKKVAKLIKENSIPVGKVARVGGDEFAMLLPEKNKKEAMMIAEEIRRRLESINLLKEGRATLTISAGVSENPIDGATRDEIFKKAIESLQQAKISGKNKVYA